MIRAGFPAQHNDPFPPTPLSQDLPDFKSFLFIKYFSPVLEREYDMILTIPFYMC